MNSVLQLKGQFEHQKNPTGFGPKNLPINTQVSVQHLEQLKNELESVLNTWRKETFLGGALVSVYYRDVVAKSNRISSLLSYKSLKSNDSIRGAKFAEGDKPKHIFTHFVGLIVLEDSINKLSACISILKKSYHGIIAYEDIDLLNTKTKKYEHADLISQSAFIQVIIDAYYVERFGIERATEAVTEQTIVTIYNTGIRTIDLMQKLGIDMIDAEMIGETTLRLSPTKMKLLQDKAPYLISMQVRDLAEISPEALKKCEEDQVIAKIDDPKNEPTVGVIDTLFYEDVYFGKWVKYECKVSKDISITPDDFFHGTSVTSIIVDGPNINPNLDDGCGNFQVRHFGVATGGRFSSFTILKSIREIIAQNADIKVWNLSLGSAMEIQKNFISPEAAELDRIQSEYDVIFVIAGTNKPDSVHGEMRIGAPADSLNSLVVNAVNSHDMPASYHRVGPVLSFFHKPDLSYFGGDKGDKMRVCSPSGEYFVSGTSYAAPWITRKLAYLIHNMGLSREVAKALLIDSAAGWNRRDDEKHDIGYGVVPQRIEDIITSADDEIRFIMTGSTDSYETYTYSIPVPTSMDKYPFFARATLCYFPYTSRDQGVDYTNTEMDIHFGRVKEDKNGKVHIKSIDNNRQGNDGANSLYEGMARKLYRKWDNIKHISEEIKKGARPRIRYGNGNWGLSIRTKERLKTTRDHSTPFGVVVTLKEMNGVNRIDDFVKLCMVRGWIVNRIDIDNRVDVYQKAEEEITFE